MKRLALLTLSLALLGACASTYSGPSAVATLAPASDQTAAGTVVLTQLADGAVEVKVDLTGVPPGVHGFHIHEKGDCANNGGAAGMHFNPATTDHGAPNMPPHHAGDFGNVTANEAGEVHTTFTTRSVTLDSGANSAVGRAFILHAAPDDLKTQPTGNAGARIACGVVALR